MPSERVLPPGTAWCEHRTAAVDEAIAGWMAGTEQRGCAVLALGGYARRRLCPASDVDLLLLHSGASKADLERLVQEVVYPLWDIGASVGYAVHTPRDVLRKARDNLDSATALVHRRLVAGSPGLADELTARVNKMLRHDGARLARELHAADQARRQKAGDTPGLLEPNLKEGAGGLRDLASLRWAAAALLGESRLDRLVGARYIGAGQYRELIDAEETLLTARCALHLAIDVRRPGGGADRLRLEVQDQVAELIGLSDGDELLRQVGLAMRAVAHAHHRVWPKLLEHAVRGRARRSPPRALGSGIDLVDGYVEIADQAADPSRLAAVLQGAVFAARHGTHLGRTTAAQLRHELEAATLEWDGAARTAFVQLLREGPRARGAWADLDQAGAVVACLPGWRQVRGRPQRNPYHRFDLDTHALETVAELVVLVEEDDKARALWDGLEDRQAGLLLGALLHDVGKAWPGDHSEVGAGVAVDWLRTMGFGDDAGAWVATLVREHLLLPEAATRRDVEDPAEMERLVRVVGDQPTLDALYLLAVADGRATGPTASTSWRVHLLGQLHARLRAALDPGSPSSLDAPVGATLPAGASGARQAMAVLEDGPAEGTRTLHVVAPDRHGLLADCAGTLAGHGLAVLDAWAENRVEERVAVAVDRFVVEAAHGTDWDAVTSDLMRAAEGDLLVDAQVERLERRLGQPSRPRAAVTTKVVVEGRDDGLRVEVRTQDRPGLLYRLVRALTEAGLDISGARVHTMGPEAHDVFFLRGGEPRPDLGAVETLVRRVADARPNVTPSIPG